MTARELVEKSDFTTLNEGEHFDTDITKIFCCDLLSIAMSKAPAYSAWITVMANINTLAVGVLADVACIILAEDANLDEAAMAKARQQGVTVLLSSLPIFESALIVHNFIN